jgi:hypothetical protein
MTSQFENNIEPNPNPVETSPWNPFFPTKRDLQRTEILAKKDPIVTGILMFIFPLAGMIYLNRGLNSLKIFGYTFLIGLSILGNLSDNITDEDLEGMKSAVRLTSLVVLTTESVRTVTLARKRLASKQDS